MCKLFIFLASTFVFQSFSPALAEADPEHFTIYCTGNTMRQGPALKSVTLKNTINLSVSWFQATLLTAITREKIISNAS